MASSSSAMDAFDLPFDVVKKSNGFGIDIGGSVAKVVYRDIDDWDLEKNEPKKLEGDLARIRTVVFARESWKDAIDFIKEHCHISRPEGQEVLIYSTGLGGNEYGKQIEEKLHVKLRNLAEFDCFIKAFCYLVTCTPESKFLYEMSADTLEEIHKNIGRFAELIAQMNDIKQTKAKFPLMSSEKLDKSKNCIQGQKQEDNKPYGEKDDFFPCLLGMLGSASAFMKVDEDGTFSMVDGSNKCGRFFLGLGSILTGAKSYNELITLAESGDGSNVDFHGRDLNIRGADDFYSQIDPDQLLFSFGKGVNASAEDFKKADLASSLLKLICVDTAQMADLVSRSSDVKKVYIAGGFGARSVARDIMSKEFTRRSFMGGTLGERELLFIRNGISLGALGCFLEGCT